MISLSKAKPWFLLGVFLICMCGLMLQIIETRILSVISWYHLAFFSISMAMFGMTAGSLFVYFKERWFPAERLFEILAVPPGIVRPPHPKPLPQPPRGEVAFADVHFAYPTRRNAPALNGVSFRVRPGEKLAVDVNRQRYFGFQHQFLALPLPNLGMIGGWSRNRQLRQETQHLEARQRTSMKVIEHTVIFAGTGREHETALAPAQQHT